MKRSRLLDTVTQLQVQGITTCVLSPHPVLNLHISSSSIFDSILAEFPGVTQLCSYDRPAKHTVTHYIVTTGPLLVLVVFLQSGFALPRMSLNTCFNWESSDPPQAAGHLLFTWSPRRLQAIGAPVEITVHLTMSLLRTGIPFHTSRISPFPYMVLLSSANWTWCEPTTRFPWSWRTFQRQPLSLLLASLSFCACPLDSATQHKLSNGSLTKSCSDCPSVTLIWMMCSLPVLHQKSISTIFALSLHNSRSMESAYTQQSAFSVKSNWSSWATAWTRLGSSHWKARYR